MATLLLDDSTSPTFRKDAAMQLIKKPLVALALVVIVSGAAAFALQSDPAFAA
jgi:hypothetical protein